MITQFLLSKYYEMPMICIRLAKKISIIKVLTLLSIPLALLYSCQSEDQSQGRWLYEQHCAPCHMEDGSGLASLYPPLAKSDYLAINQEIFACIIRYGLYDTIIVNEVTYDVPMEGISELKDVEVHNIINYVNKSWGNDIPHTNFKVTEDRLKQCRQD